MSECILQLETCMSAPVRHSEGRRKEYSLDMYVTATERATTTCFGKSTNARTASSAAWSALTLCQTSCCVFELTWQSSRQSHGVCFVPR